MGRIYYIEVSIKFFNKHKEKYPENFPEPKWIWYNKGYGSGSYYYYFRGEKSHPLYEKAVLNQDYLSVKGIEAEKLPQAIKKMIPNDLGDVKVQGSLASHTGRLVITKEPYGFNVNDKAFNEKGEHLSGINPAEIRRKNDEEMKIKIEKKANELLKKGEEFVIKTPKGERTGKVVLKESFFGEKRMVVIIKKGREWNECLSKDKSYLLEV